MAFAAPVDAGPADAATVQAIQDACDRIPYNERHEHRYVYRLFLKTVLHPAKAYLTTASARRLVIAAIGETNVVKSAVRVLARQTFVIEVATDGRYRASRSIETTARKHSLGSTELALYIMLQSDLF